MDLESLESLESLEPLVVEEQWWDLYDFTENNIVNIENDENTLYNEDTNDRRKTISVITYIENLFIFENNSINSDSVCSNGNGSNNNNLPFKGNLFEKVNFQEKMKI
jgi:hypothetical protein